MSKVNDGGPAFPNVPDGAGDKWSDWDKGVSMRDYFAAKALAGMLGGEPGTHLQFANAAKEAYEYADAMLKARGEA